MTSTNTQWTKLTATCYHSADWSLLIEKNTDGDWVLIDGGRHIMVFRTVTEAKRFERLWRKGLARPC